MSKTCAMLALLCVFGVRQVQAHCEIPCGIYNDPMRITMIREHIDTIEKSMKNIKQLSSQEIRDDNQMVRWINNKEKHANDLQQIVTQYFMAQRLKPVDPKNKAAYDEYINKLTVLHEMYIYAMKTKQSVDADIIDTLKELTLEFEDLYFGRKKIQN